MKLSNIYNILKNKIAGLYFLPELISRRGHIYVSFAIPRFRKSNINWGDDLNIVLIELLTGKKVIPYQFSWVRHKHFLCIGSVLQWYSDEDAIIWGAGLMSSKVNFNPPQKVLAVRGPLTRDCLLKRGIECPEVYGDPALLVPLLYKPSKTKKYKIGIICHFSESKNFDLQIPSDLNKEEINIINISKYGLWTDFLDNILYCETILTSSLHGIIIADAYNIPNLLVSFSNYHSSDNHFKFRDYFQSVNKTFTPPLDYNKIISISEAKNFITTNWQPPEIDLNPLITSCPFEIQNKIELLKTLGSSKKDLFKQ